MATYPDRTFKPKEMARKLGVPKTDYAEFRDLIKAAARKGVIAKHRGNNFGSIRKVATLQGDLQVKTQGYGFLITPEGQDDVFISQKNMSTAMHGDTVDVQLYAEAKGRSKEGRVVRIVRRARQNIVGTYEETRNYGFVVPDDLKMPRDIFVPREDSKKAKHGHKVVVQVVDWADERSNPIGKIDEVLGFPQDPGVDVMSVVKSFDLPINFPKPVEQEAANVSLTIPPEEIKRRLDLRKQVCFTIDPKDAKDYDDAVSIEALANKNFRLGVHIADVSYYVSPKTKVDREALNRGTSVYLVDRVVPMLPEKLSNHICSLRPEEDRLTMSCIMEVTAAGDVVDYKIAETVINSKRRFTYEEVQTIFDKPKSRMKFAKDLHLMHGLSQTLIRRRQELGSLDFDIPEVKVDLDDKGVPVAIRKRLRQASNRMIEEFMLLANRTVTEHVALKLGENGRVPPFLYRVHEEPAEAKMDDFRKFVTALGYPLDPHKKVTGKLLGEYLVKLKGKPEEGMIEGLLLRSMMKAKYASNCLGHFGLGFKHYTHFTSPIRRYPDLAVHRLLKKYAHGVDFEKNKQELTALDTIAQKSNDREVVALEAERESIKMKKVEYMQRHLGDEFDGVISGVVAFGIFVEITELLVDGLVHISDLADDYYHHDEKQYQLVGNATGKTYRLGDPVRVRVVRVSVSERVVDFTLV